MEMGGMFTTVKVRDDVQPGVYKDPGWYKHPPGTIAYEYTGQIAQPSRAPSAAAAPARGAGTVNVRKPSGHSGH
jgi:hypothetical protein